MILGLLFIFAGILVYVFPQILVLIISFFLIITGCVILLLRWQYARMEQRPDLPLIHFFMNW